MSYNNITFGIANEIALVSIDRPERLNALNLETFAELDRVFDEIIAAPEIRGVLVTGNGEKAFVAGADITEIRDLGLSDGIAFSRTGQKVFNKIEACEKPVIALVNGFALGGGCELALACHLRIASEKAKFGQPEVNLGLVPGYGGTQRLPRLVGRGRALELLLTGDTVSAEEALQMGLVNRVVKADELMDAGKELMKVILSKGPVAVSYMLQAVHQGLNTTLEEGIRLEANYFGMACSTEDVKEGTTAFLEKRRPHFKGR
jgi:enoyl-CoA hydratase